MKIFKKSLSILMATTLLVTATACGNPSKSSKSPSTAPSQSSVPTSETPKKETPKELTMYIGVVEQQAIKIAEEFEKATGIKVNFVRMSGGEILGRIRAEKENPQASVWYGGSADSFITAKQEGLLKPYISPSAEKISDQFKDKEGYWTGIYQGYLGFICDERYFEENKLEKPKSWDDLLKPEFKGQIMMANPGSSSTGYLILSTMVQMRSEEEALKFMKQLNGQVKQYTKAGEAPAKSAALGECAIGITFLHNGIRLMKEGFTNIGLSVPEEGTSYELGSVAMINGAPEEEAAKIFIDWCLTPECQEIGQKYTNSFQFLTNPDSKTPDEALKLKDTKLIDYDFESSGKNKDRLLEAWDNAVK
ncbi:MAG TPA: iron ABC transporter substrate-binding protein [Ruminiclostridium sp.]|jgi:iron(III) transport system substrate-binding protein|nr:iron ABC transporter substrate-binding protein [Ruminiclostridium sp.]